MRYSVSNITLKQKFRLKWLEWNEIQNHGKKRRRKREEKVEGPRMVRWDIKQSLLLPRNTAKEGPPRV